METTTGHGPNVEVVSDAQALADRSVEVFVVAAQEAIAARGVFHTALSGGQTPARFFQQLAVLPEARALPWEKVHVFWVDERYVPPDSEASNYRLAAEGFLDKIDIPRGNVHRIPTEHEDIREAARAYERTIREVFGLTQPPSAGRSEGSPPEVAVPQFDLIVLGMGSDGHTGSLFPNSYATFDVNDLVCAVYAPVGATHAAPVELNRITLTHPVLLAAWRLLVLVSGREKARTLRKVLTSEPDEVKYPIHVLWPALDKVTWLVDREAAAEV